MIHREGRFMSDTNKKTSFIADFSIIREIIYYYFLYGCKSADDFEKLNYSKKMYNNYKNKISAYIYEEKYVTEKKEGRKKVISYKMDSYSIHHNYLCKAYTMSSDFTGNVAGQLILVMQILSNISAKGKSISQIQEELENKTPRKEDFCFRSFVYDTKGYGAINRLSKLNLIKNISNTNTFSFVLTSNPLESISNSKMSPRDFLDFISLCRIITPPYTAGNMVLETALEYYKTDINIKKYKTPFIIKGDFFSQVLDDNIFYDIINIMSTKSSAKIEYKRTDISCPETRTITVYPIKFVSNNGDGRRYLFAWDLKYEKSVFLRIDKIKSVSALNDNFGNLTELDFEEEYISATKYSINGTTILAKDKEAPEKISISFIASTRNDNNEDFKRHTSYLFKDSEFTKIDDNHYSGDVYVNSFKELKPWLRSNVGYVKLTDKDSSFTIEMDAEIKEWKKLYGII